MNTFTDAQKSNWQDYEAVRQSGVYNMFDPRARRAAGLNAEEYVFVMRNYAALKAACEGKDDSKCPTKP